MLLESSFNIPISSVAIYILFELNNAELKFVWKLELFIGVLIILKLISYIDVLLCVVIIKLSDIYLISLIISLEVNNSEIFPFSMLYILFWSEK